MIGHPEQDPPSYPETTMERAPYHANSNTNNDTDGTNNGNRGTNNTDSNNGSDANRANRASGSLNNDENGTRSSPSSEGDRFGIFCVSVSKPPPHILAQMDQRRHLPIGTYADSYRLWASSADREEEKNQPRQDTKNNRREEDNKVDKDENKNELVGQNSDKRPCKKPGNGSGVTSGQLSGPSSSSHSNSGVNSRGKIGAPLRRCRSPAQYRSPDPMAMPVRAPPQGGSQDGLGPLGTTPSTVRFRRSGRNGQKSPDSENFTKRVNYAAYDRPWGDGVWVPTAEDRRQLGLSDHDCPICYFCCWVPFRWLFRKMTAGSQETEDAESEQPSFCQKAWDFFTCCCPVSKGADEEREPLIGSNSL